MFSTWYYIVNQNLTLLYCVHNSISFYRIPKTTGRNAAPNHYRVPTVFYPKDASRPLLTFSTHIDDLFKFGFMTRPVAADLQSSLCVI